MSSTNSTTTVSPAQPNGTIVSRMLVRSAQETFVFVGIYTLLVCLVIVGNSLVIVAYKRNPKLRTMTNLFFVSLAVSDIIVGGISIPMWIHILLYELNNRPTTNLMRQTYTFFDIFSALTSIAHLTAISIERKIAISKPLRHRIIPNSYYYSTVVTIWAYGFMIATLFVSDLKSPIWKEYRGLATTMVGFILPLFIMSCMYANIYKNVKMFNARRRFYSTSSLHGRVKRERTTVKTVLIITGLFLISWLPFFTLSVMYIFCKDCIPYGPVLLHLLDFMKILHYSNSAVNPVVYAYRSVEMRLTVLRTVAPCFARSVSSSVRTLQAQPAVNASAFIACNGHPSASVPPPGAGPRVSRL